MSGSHVKSDYERTIIQHLSPSPYTGHQRLDTSSCALFTGYRII